MSCCCGTQTERCCECQSGLYLKKSSLLHKIGGPYPDEVIMSALDRILFMWGATKINHMMAGGTLEPIRKDKSCSPAPSCSSVCSLDRRNSCDSTCPSTTSTKITSPPCSRAIDWRKESPGPSSPKPSCIKAPSSRLSAAASCPRHRSPRVDFKRPADDIQKRQNAGKTAMTERLIRSISACSVACQRLKTSLTPKETPRSGRKGQKWLWTRLIRTKNGCQVYEVYKDSNAKSPPSKIGSQAPAMVFLVMRNGNIMPFESITTV